MDGPQQGMPPGASPVGAERYRTVTGATTAPTATIADLEAADAFSTLVSIPTLLVAITAGVVFLVWL